MTLFDETVAAYAARLDDAQRTATPTAQLSGTGALGIAEAYRVQHALLERRIARGEQLIGRKLGFTSRAKAVQMGVHDLIIGSLTDAMRIDDNGVFDVSGAIHPRIEPEVAYLLDEDGEVRAVAPALEIIDSRYADFRFDLGDVIADNTSACAFVIGSWRSPEDAGPLDNRAVQLEIDGILVQTGSTAAILGDPARAVTAARRLASVHHLPAAGAGVLLAGAATAAVTVPQSGVVEAAVSGLGRVSVRIESTRDPAQEGAGK